MAPSEHLLPASRCRSGKEPMKKPVLSALCSTTLALSLSAAGLVVTTTAAHADPIPAPIGADKAPAADAAAYLAAAARGEPHHQDLLRLPGGAAVREL